MRVAVDVHYTEDGLAQAGAVGFMEWSDSAAVLEWTASVRDPEPYVPGELYRRELPALVSAIARYALAIDTVLVDGFVDLGPDRPGLGRHLHRAFGGKIAVVGVAKTPFVGATGVPVVRGDSKKPLYVSSTADVEEAAEAIAQMHGDFRLPTLIRRADQLARRGIEPGTEP